MNKGFTLIEFLLYIGMTATVIAVLGSFSFQTIWGKARLTSMDEVSQNVRFVLEKMSLAIRNAQAINSPAAGTFATALSLKVLDLTKNPTIFDLSGGAVRISEGANPPEGLTSSEVEVANMKFSNISYTGTPGTIRIEMTVRFKNPSNRREFDFEEIFYATSNVRKR